jgi:hypothetical protein
MTTTTVALVLASVALVIAATTAVLALVVMRQSGHALTEIRGHRIAHKRTHGRADPDPEHHGTSPTVDRLATTVDELADYTAALGEWAAKADQRLRRPDDQPPNLVYVIDEELTEQRAAQLRAHPEQLPTTAMRATDRPGVRRP